MKSYQEILKKADLVYADGFGKGFPLWTEKGLLFQQKLANKLISQFTDDFSFTIHWPREIVLEKEYASFYQNLMEKFGSIPTFVKGTQRNILVSDALPYNITKLDQGKWNGIITNYHVLRLLSAKQVPLYRDYYISPLLQLNLWMPQSLDEVINYILLRLQRFLVAINLPSIILEYDGVEGYSSKVFMVAALNQKGKLQTIIQFSILSDQLLKQFGVHKRCVNGSVVDIGYSQKLFALLADNHSDSQSFYIPSTFSDCHAAVVYKGDASYQQLLQQFIRQSQNLTRIMFFDTLGEFKLNQIRAECEADGFGVFAIHRNDKGREFFDIYGKHIKGILEIDNIEQLLDFFTTSHFVVDRFFFERGQERLKPIIKNGFGNISEFSEKGCIVIPTEE